MGAAVGEDRGLAGALTLPEDTEAHLLLVERGRWWVEATYG